MNRMVADTGRDSSAAGCRRRRLRPQRGDSGVDDSVVDRPSQTFLYGDGLFELLAVAHGCSVYCCDSRKMITQPAFDERGRYEANNQEGSTSNPKSA